ncbi:sugar transferase [Staphylococcus massiliensis]|uniref:sugar transferase n=1 Tax=Staphylococcus massiliensis TaxID=555791 RepID=UPI00036A998D|nr:sugar transferase [Staphylococcus massiliensis]MCG3399440.1 sugar transferase [Staphylococcus massiliensis]MCG3402460.1 sugar transferase [Staphylococcus massiliensis]PNZ99473.1 sugar transferase [Staphylococcus massiliensis CCUG 55927]
MKRAFDILSSLVGLIILGPFMLLIALVIRRESDGPALYIQSRTGKGDTYFNAFKFRTMHINAPIVPRENLTPAKYTTRSGTLLRASSMDELPQLFNILSGEMSFVGPKSAQFNQYQLISKRKLYGLNQVKPGLINFSHTVGGPHLTEDQRLKLESYYIKEQSFMLDCFTIYKMVQKQKELPARLSQRLVKLL